MTSSLKLPKELNLTVTEVRLTGVEYSYAWALRDNDVGIIKYGSTLDGSYDHLYKGKLVNIDGKMYMVVNVSMDMLDMNTTKTTIHFMEVDDEQWVIKFEDKVKGEI